MFYLTGGIALAEFYLAHRKSFDFDISTIYWIIGKEHWVIPRA